MDEDILIGLHQISTAFPFGYNTLKNKTKRLKAMGIIQGPRAFGKPPNRRRCLWAYKTIIQRFLIQNPTF